MSHAALRVGICGVGTVGLATLEILRGQSLALTARCGQPLSVTCVGSRREHPDHDYGDARVSGTSWTWRVIPRWMCWWS